MNSVLPLLGLCAVVTSCLAAPTLNRDAAVEPSLVRTKRADEIIYDGQNNPRAKKSSDDDSSPAAATAEDATKTAAEPQPESAAKPAATVEDLEKTEKPEEVKVEEDKAVENTAEEMSEPTDEVAAGPETEEAQQTTTENEDENGADTNIPVDEESEQPLEERERREATHSRQQRSAAEARTMMVAENMAAPGDQKLRAKRDLDADELRELFDAQRAPPGEYDGQDYEEVEEVPVEQEEDGGEEDLEPEPQQRLPWRYYDLGRPKRGGYGRALSDAVLEEEAEREAVRELLAERAAEEAREALLEYLVGGRPKFEVEPDVDEEQADDDGELDRVEEDENDGAEEEAEDEERREGDSSEEEPEGEELELIPSNDDDDEFFGGRRINEVEQFGDQEAQAVPDEAAAAEKRLEYPYSYEPYGGRWGALVPGSKRSDRDPYDRLYRLAEALSGPSIGLQAADDGSSRNVEYVK